MMQRVYKLISIVFHPILLPLVATLSFFVIGNSNLIDSVKLKIILLVGIGTYLSPVILLIILKRKKLIQSIEVRNIDERKIPILFMTVLFYVLGKTLGRIDPLFLLSNLFIGCAISLAICYMLFVKKLKLSIHMLGMASFISFTLIMSIYMQVNLLMATALLFIASGVVATARIQLKAHSLQEINLGFIVGFLPQLLFIYFH